MSLSRSARTLALALLLLVCATLAVRGAEPRGPTVVLQLPPSMSPEAVRDLIADLTAKGAQPAAPPVEPSAAASPALLTAANLAAQVWGATKRAVRALPVLRRAPQAWVGRIRSEGGAREVAILFWAVALLGLVAAPLIGAGARALLARRQHVEPG